MGHSLRCLWAPCRGGATTGHEERWSSAAMVDKLIKIRGEHMKGKGIWTFGIGVVSIVLLAGVFLTTALVRDSDAAPAKKLTIGMIACLTGFFSPNDVPAAHEAQMTADMINEKGGITVKGEKYQLEVVIED